MVVVPKNYIKIFVSQVSTEVKKKTSALALAAHKINFLGPIFGLFLDVWPKKL